MHALVIFTAYIFRTNIPSLISYYHMLQRIFCNVNLNLDDKPTPSIANIPWLLLGSLLDALGCLSSKFHQNCMFQLLIEQ